MPKPHLFPDIPAIHEETQLYTQRRTVSESPANFKFTMALVLAWIISKLDVAFFRPRILPDPLEYVPAAEGNPTDHRNAFVIASDNTDWFIDYQGRAKRLTRTAGDFEFTNPNVGVIYQDGTSTKWQNRVNNDGANYTTQQP
jgi:hypothetical protein